MITSAFVFYVFRSRSFNHIPFHIQAILVGNMSNASKAVEDSIARRRVLFARFSPVFDICVMTLPASSFFLELSELVPRRESRRATHAWPWYPDPNDKK